MKKIFPIKKYEFKIDKESKNAIIDLKKETEISGSLVTVITKKKFIGRVDDSSFKLITSIIGKGAFCVFNGEIKGKMGTLNVQIHKAFRILISIWLLLSAFGILSSIAKIGFIDSIGLIVMMIVVLLILRFVVMDLFFNSVAKNGIEKLKNTIGIIEIKENEV